MSEGAEEDEASGGGNGYEGDIFEGEIFEPDGIDPMESLNILRKPQFQLQNEARLAEEEEEADDTIKDLHRSEL